jgi:hypothetical protein
MTPRDGWLSERGLGRLGKPTDVAARDREWARRLLLAADT